MSTPTRTVNAKWPLSEVRYQAAEAQDAIIGRDHAIRGARNAGASLQQIADAAGLSKSGVAKILNRSETS